MHFCSSVVVTRKNGREKLRVKEQSKAKGTYCMQRWQPRDQVRVQDGVGLGPKTTLPPPTVGQFCGGFR